MHHICDNVPKTVRGNWNVIKETMF